jgi:hypothetical protein
MASNSTILNNETNNTFFQCLLAVLAARLLPSTAFSRLHVILTVQKPKKLFQIMIISNLLKGTLSYSLASVIPSAPILKVASASGNDGDATIFAIRVSPRPLRSATRV